MSRSLALALLLSTAGVGCATGRSSAPSSGMPVALVSSPAPPQLSDAPLEASKAAPVATTAPAAPEPAAARPPLKRIAYARTGGFIGAAVRGTVTPGGAYRFVEDRRGVTGPYIVVGEMTPDDRRRLAAAFAGWDRLAPEYKAANGTADDYRIEIRYGDKTVVASDAADDVPPAFWAAYEQLKTLHASK